jgi:4-amino-4-deoxy-L-arabinose transferase-like glycosyltransferase
MGRAALVAVAAAIAFFPFIGRRDWSSREALHAEIAREMWSGESGLLIPHNAGAIYDQKPPLFHWLAALSFEASGGTGAPSLGAARLPSAVAGIACVVATFSIGRALLGEGAALLSALVLAATPAFIRMARSARPDMLLCAFVLIACAAAARAARRPERARGAALGFGLATGLAVLAKGPLGLLPLIFAAALRAFEGAAPFGARGARRLALASFFAPIAAWTVPVLFHPEGFAYLRALLTQPDLTTGVAKHARSFLFYLGPFPAGFAPFLPLFGLAIADVFRRRARLGAPLATAAAIFLVLSAIPGKRWHYLVPVYPFAALAVAAAVERRRHSGRAWRIAPPALAGALILSFAAAEAPIEALFGEPPDRARRFATEVAGAVPPGARIAAMPRTRTLAEVSFVLGHVVDRLAPAEAPHWIARTAAEGGGYLLARASEQAAIEAAAGCSVALLFDDCALLPGSALPPDRDAIALFRIGAPPAWPASPTFSAH